MAGILSEESAVGRSLEEISSGQRCQSGEALAEWRSCEQLENGTPSTSPPYWDSDDSDDDGGPKPSELYGKYTWKMEKFSQINKRELRSNAFEVGGYKWYILIYPQGCDVCNHLSLFLCVANHDKLLPGWSHFAQFTIAVVNKDPKKSKYSDTLHRFWKKEHDWGWKKFMELSKVSDGFVDADTLIIKAQVQVIREKADRPFRCLDCQYRRELVRVYLTNVEQICRRFVEERRGKLGKLLEDKSRWSSFCTFWLGIDQNSRRRMSREKMDMILKVIVKQFFIEKEVTSTLVMDSLYSGLKALEGQSKCKKVKGKLQDGEDIPAPIVQVEKDMFVLVDDVLLLLERAAMEPLPPKDEKGPQNRTKDGPAGEDFNKDSIEREERRLTELGRRTVEIFVLAHIFSNKIEVAYQEAVALKRQEELIREEEAAWLAESEQKAKRGVAEKEKKSKKKQGKQKRNNRKGKDKVKEEKTCVVVQDKQLYEDSVDDGKALEETQLMLEKDDALEDASDVSDMVDSSVDMLQADSEDRDASPVNWDTDTSEVQPPAEVHSSAVSSSTSTVQNGMDKRNSSVMDDSSSTCSTDSAPSVVMNGSDKGNSFPNYKSQKSPTRGKNQRSKMTSEETGGPSGADGHMSELVADRHHRDVSPSGKGAETNESGTVVSSSQDRSKGPEQNMVKNGEEVTLLQRKPSSKDHVDTERLPKEKALVVPYSPRSPPRNANPVAQLKSDPRSNLVGDLSPGKKMSANSSQKTDKAASLMSVSQTVFGSRPDPVKTASPKLPERVSGQQVPDMSRPLSAPVMPGSKSASPAASTVQAAPAAPLLSRSVSSAGRLGPDPSSVTHAYVPQSYLNAIVGTSVSASSASFTHPPPSASSAVNPLPAFSHQTSLISASMFPSQASDRIDTSCVSSSISFGSTTREIVQGGRHWIDSPQRDISRSRHTQGALADEFPHLDIINELLLDDEQQGGVSATMDTSAFRCISSGPNRLNQHFSLATDMGIPGDVCSSASSCRFDRSRSYHDDGFQRDYVSGSHFDSPREYIPQANLMPCANGHIDGLVQNQWQVNGPDLSLLSMRNSGGDGYPYNIHDYSNLACGIEGYTVFRPSSGH
ncbi:hypothetical protein Ancab_013189 [Ancistrocladus abbreviatus]